MNTSHILQTRKFVLPEIVFGAGVRRFCARYAQNLHMQKILIVTDEGVIKAGWANEIIQLLNQENIEHVIFSQVHPNPRDFETMNGARFYLENKCDSILAIGGGSAIDCAKGIGIVSTNHKNIIDFAGVDKVLNPMPPIICIPTTGGTSADVSQFAIINHTAAKTKIAIISSAVIADVALIDPETLITMSPFLTACTGMDALVHAIEAYVSNASSAVTDLHAIDAIRRIGSFLEKSVENPSNLEYRGEIMMASMLAGFAFSNASLGCVHALAHSLGGFSDLPHGECNAILLPHVINFNYIAAPEKYTHISKVLKIEDVNTDNAKTKIFEYLTNLNHQIGIPSKLSAKGVKPSEIEDLSKSAIKDPCNATNPRLPHKRDLEIIYQEAM